MLFTYKYLLSYQKMWAQSTEASLPKDILFGAMILQPSIFAPNQPSCYNCTLGVDISHLALCKDSKAELNPAAPQRFRNSSEPHELKILRNNQSLDENQPSAAEQP